MNCIEALSTLVLFVMAGGAAIHAVLNKREVRSAAAWVGLICLVPAVGPLLYLLLGINRIRRAAGRARHGMLRYRQTEVAGIATDRLEIMLAARDAHLSAIARTVERTGDWPLRAGNRVSLLCDGDEAYPAMLNCIDAAERTIAFGTYIFDDDSTGRRFVDALAAARARGVEVRVLIDDAGARYSWPSIDRKLKRRGVTVARFLRVLVPWSVAYANLRNHRKVLVVDGRVGFTGGMNIRHACVRAHNPRASIQDVHFRIDGPVVTQLLRVFAEDWTFTTGEVLAGESWFPELASAGPTTARVISDGPDFDLDCMRWALHGALGSARRSVRVVTPYFLPDETLITALNTAALRGVEVDLVLPARSNLRVVQWAMRGELWKVLNHGCRVWLTPPPFDHAKLMTVDGAWALIGSANWDPRSLRLNFELGVECYDRKLVQQLDAVIEGRLCGARRLSAVELAGAPLLMRVRDATARLLAPYL